MTDEIKLITYINGITFGLKIANKVIARTKDCTKAIKVLMLISQNLTKVNYAEEIKEDIWKRVYYVLNTETGAILDIKK